MGPASQEASRLLRRPPCQYKAVYQREQRARARIQRRRVPGIRGRRISTADDESPRVPPSELSRAAAMSHIYTYNALGTVVTGQGGPGRQLGVKSGESLATGQAVPAGAWTTVDGRQPCICSSRTHGDVSAASILENGGKTAAGCEKRRPLLGPKSLFHCQFSLARQCPSSRGSFG